MKHLLILTALLLPAQGQDLSEVDRQLLLDKLQEIQESANSAAKSRFGTAVSAFKAAASSDVAAHELWLKCVEKVDFQDEAKKTSDFREWRKRHKDRTDSPGFRRALRHQLNWLLLTIEVTQNPAAISGMSDQAISAIEAILGDGQLLENQGQLLKASVLSSYFARAYDLGGLQVQGWSNAPLNIGTMYELIILPPWQNEDSIEKLRRGWLKRIEHEGLAVKAFSREGEKDRIPEFEKWLANDRLGLMWKMEVDLFRAGDQRPAALRMLDHLKKNLNHNDASAWINDFTALVSGKKLPAEIEAEKKELDGKAPATRVPQP